MSKSKTSEAIFNDFLNEIDDSISYFNNATCVPFFRGCNKSSHELLPSLFRNTKNIKNNIKVNYLENNLFYDFCARGNGIIHNQKDWEILFKMQHHGIPTRLLDWTESIGVALYFALEYSDEIDKPCIWFLDPYELNDSEKNKKRFTDLNYSTLYNPDRDFKLNYYDSFIVGNKKNKSSIFNQPQALYPIKSNDRIKAQWGVFTTHGNDERCISKIAPKAVKQFIIPDNAIPAARKFLKRAMVNHFSMFPDLEGLKKYLKTEYYNK